MEASSYEKKERYIAFGVLHRYANPKPIPFEGGAFWIAMEEK